LGVHHAARRPARAGAAGGRGGSELSGQINVYSTRPDPVPIDDIVAGLRERGFDATWIKDDIWAAADERPWRSGRFTLASGEVLRVGLDEVDELEREGLVEDAAAAGPEAVRVAGELRIAYRLYDAPEPLLLAGVETLAAAAPCLILDVDSGELRIGRMSSAGPGG
jgi:hypothetical protein